MKQNLKSMKVFITAMLLMGVAITFPVKAQTIVNFTSNGTWTCPTGVTGVTIECWGGGGAGAAVGGNPAAGGGAAGGAYARKFVAVTAGNNYTVTVGATKTSGSKTATASANTGNPSWFGAASTVYAQGGPGAVGGADTNNFNGAGAVGSGSLSIGDVIFNGGNAANGASASGVAGGAAGGAAGPSANGGNASGGTRGTGASGNPSTGNGANGPANSTAGPAGSIYGGGGAGGKANSSADRAGGSGAAGYVRITYQTATAPSNLVATTAGPTQINLTWTDNSNNETGFQIERSTTSGSGFALIQTTAANVVSFSSTTLTASTTYYYRIRAIATGYNSAYTTQASATTFPPPPTAPGGLTATTASSTSINLNWTDNSNNETGFQIERSTTSGSGFALIQTTAANAVSFSSTGLTANTMYYYRIRATNTGGGSAYTAEANATTLPNPPTAPAGLTATASSSTSINLVWTDNSNNETGFQIERSTTSGSGFTMVQTTPANAVSFSNTGLNVNTTYYYRIMAVNTGGSSAYTTEASATTLTAAQQSVNDWAFQYTYDSRQRMTMKKVPGAEPVFMVYDLRDRLVLTQDGNQRLANTWSFTKYDVLNRPIITGIYSHGTSASQQVMAALISTSIFFDTYDGSATFHGYTNNVFPINNLEVLTVSYYDNYDFKTLWGGTTYIYSDDNLSATVINGTYNQPDVEFLHLTGLVTGSKTKVLDGANTYLKTISYFDDRLRPIQVIGDTYKGGVIAGTDRASMLYDFPGKVIKAKTTHLVGASQKTIARRMEYDPAGRLLKTFHQVDAQTEVLLSKNNFNELGQLIDKQLHSTDNGTTFKQSVDHRYNIRGWLTSFNNASLINDGITNDDTGDLFGMNLLYEQTDANLANTGQFNGNISALKWSANLGLAIEKERAYRFGYDPMNRLLAATHLSKTAAWAASGSFYEDGFSYDLNGNILNLNRKGAAASTIDVLGYTYSGNQLQTVTDTGDKTKGFIEPTSTTGNDYSYDVNGNMKVDQNKGITSIVYNHLNLPTQVNKGATDYIVYTYDAAGRKLRQQVFGATPKSTDYVGEFIYESNALKFINHEEGRIIPAGNEYQYHLKDHLGNVRLTFTTASDVETATATLEDNHITEDRAAFLKYDEVRRVQSHLFDHTNGNAPSTVPGYAQRLNGSTNEKYGLTKSISVMPGDVVNVEVFAKYVDTNSSNWTVALATLLNAIATGTAGPGVVVDGTGYSTSGQQAFPFGTVLDKSGDSGLGPKAYLNYLVFDKNFVLIPSKSGFKRLGNSPREYGQDALHEQLSKVIAITEPGYVYVYLSNEEATPLEVYFDDFKVTHVKSPVVQTQDYYPFGLTFNSYERENSVPNNKKFQGQEHVDDLGLNWDSYRYRNHQPDIGRFFNIDPMAGAFYYNSPYAFSENKVTTHREMEGLEAYFIHGTISDKSMWKEDITKFIMRELQPYVNSRQDINTEFAWNDATGGPFKRNWIGNSGGSNRAAAARMLAAYIMKTRKEGQGITLVTHSHGGNVAIQAAKILFEKHNITVNIIGFNTPAFNGANDRENPWDNFGINEMIHFFTEGDNVADGAGWGEAENEYGGLVGGNVHQIRLSNPIKSDVVGFQQHRFDNVNWQEVLNQFGSQSDNGGEKKKKQTYFKGEKGHGDW